MVVKAGPGYHLVDYATQAYLAIVALLVWCAHGQVVPHWRGLVAAHLAGLGAIHLLVRAHARFPALPWLDLLRYCYPVLLYTALYCETGQVNLMFAGRYLDPAFIRCEQWLFGGQPALAFMANLPYLAVSELFYFAYSSYYLMIVGVSAALFLQDRRRFLHFVTVISFIFYVCYLVYIFLPVVGPQVFFERFPGYPVPPLWSVQPAPLTPNFPTALTAGPFFQLMQLLYSKFGSTGAAFPSSHVAVAVCTLCFSWRYLPRVRWVHAAAVTLLCAATVYCRYHYLIDVLAGLATVAILLPLGNWLYRKWSDVG